MSNFENPTWRMAAILKIVISPFSISQPRIVRINQSINHLFVHKKQHKMTMYNWRTGHARLGKSQWRRQEFFSGGLSPFPPLPFPSPSLPSSPSPPLRSRPPLLGLGDLGERFSSPSGSGRSPAAKRILVHFELKSRHMVATIFRTFLRIN